MLGASCSTDPKRHEKRFHPATTPAGLSPIANVRSEMGGRSKNLWISFGEMGSQRVVNGITLNYAALVSKSTRMEVYAFKLPAELVERLDAHAGHLREQSPGIHITRADALRALLISALDSVEAQLSNKRRQ